jgi:hypothetical protein
MPDDWPPPPVWLEMVIDGEVMFIFVGHDIVDLGEFAENEPHTLH